jgi:hypothetical protein
LTHEITKKNEMDKEKQHPKIDVFSWKVGFTDCYEYIENKLK